MENSYLTILVGTCYLDHVIFGSYAIVLEGIRILSHIHAYFQGFTSRWPTIPLSIHSITTTVYTFRILIKATQIQLIP